MTSRSLQHLLTLSLVTSAAVLALAARADLRAQTQDNRQVATDTDDDRREHGRFLRLPTGQYITPTFVRGAVQQYLNPGLADYPNFVAYAGRIVKDVTLRDVRKTVLQRLGRPTKIDDEPLAEGTNPDTPVINPQQTRYFWSMNGFTLQVIFLSQPKLIRQAGPLVIPKDTIIAVIVSK